MNAEFFNLLSRKAIEKFRKYEKVNIKLVNAQSAKAFNSACILNKLWPNHTNIRTADPALQSASFVAEFKENQLREEINNLEENIKHLINQQEIIQQEIQHELTEQEATHIAKSMKDLKARYIFKKENETLVKLNKLYGRDICLPSSEDKYITLSHHQLTNGQRRYLNLGMNCHIESKFVLTKKKMHLELMYQSVLQLAKEGTIMIEEGLANALRSEGHKNRATNTNAILDSSLKKAAQELKTLQVNKEITIRKADKSSNYVLMSYNDYKP